MRVHTEIIGQQTATGASAKASKLGSEERAGQAIQISSPVRIVQISGIAGGSIVKLEGSLDGTIYNPWLTGIAADNAFIVDDGPLYLRTNVTTYGSGTITTTVQKFLLDN